MDNNETLGQLKTENLVKRVLTTEIKYIVAVVIFLVGVVAPYYAIKTDIALIKANHFAHMETMNKQIEINNTEIKEIKLIEVELMKTIAENSVRVNLLEK